jgi:hypothetical protein
MRATEAEFMPDLCTVHRPVKTKMPTGGTADTDSTPYVGISCEAVPHDQRSVDEQVRGGAIRSAVRWQVTLPYGTDIRLDDVLWVTQAGSSSIVRLRVVADKTGTWGTATTIEAVRIE